MGSKSSAAAWLAFPVRAVVLLLPAGLLLLGVFHTADSYQGLLAIGAMVQAVLGVFVLVRRPSGQFPIGVSIIILYLIALGWLWLGAIHVSDWYPHLAQGILLIIPLAAFAVQTLASSGAPALRRARILAWRLASRTEWPADLVACRELPEVKAFREALHLDATPALNLLQHPRPQVRYAALAALEFRKNWRPGQAELVLQIAKNSKEADIRAAAISALANLEDRLLIDQLADFLRDPSDEVRRAATEALVWDSQRRWHWVRIAIRQALTDPKHAADGPLLFNGQVLPPEAIADLQAWASEKSFLGARAAQTLGGYYNHLLSEKPDEGLIQELQRQLADVQVPPTLRIEFAQLLSVCGHWDSALQEQLLDPANPASLRLMAAEAMLSESQHPKAVVALYDIARLANREMALATAEVAQRFLGVDLGLPAGQPLPSLHSHQAAEVTRRVMLWAQQENAVASGEGRVAGAEW
jgi:hypothetical protein